MTTGRYTDTAIKHAKELSKETQIDLFTLSNLADLAQQAGMTIIANGQAAKIFYISCPSDQEAYGGIKQRVNKLESHPNRPDKIMNLLSHTVIVKPCYIMKVDMLKSFYSGGDVMIHSVNESNVQLVIDGVTGKVIDQAAASVVSKSPLCDHAKIETNADVQRESFSCSVESAKAEATGSLCRRYSKWVYYKGRNNVSYQKYCAIPSSSVHFKDIKQALLPMHVIKIQLSKSTYPCKVIRGSNGIVVTAPLDKCAICKEVVREGPALCNSCGSIHHPRRFFRGHGHRCGSCDKTVCNRCAYWIPRAIFFRKVVCGDCAPLLGTAQKIEGGTKEKKGGGGQGGKKVKEAHILETSIDIERSDGDAPEGELRRRTSGQRRRTAIKWLKIAGTVAGIITLVSVVVLVLVQTRRK